MQLRPAAPETSAGGRVTLRRQARQREMEVVAGGSELIAGVDDHIERYFGDQGSVFHEIVSDLIHVDVHFIPPAASRPWTTLVTSGMSERPMHTPEDIEGYDYAELALCLPPKWPLEHESLKDENNYWPVRCLKVIARLPHEYETWIGPGHTIPNGDPAEPFADRTGFFCSLVVPAVGMPDGFEQLDLPDGRSVHFYSVVPLFKEEMEYKLRKGSDALIERLATLPVPELCEPTRKNVAKKRFGLF